MILELMPSRAETYHVFKDYSLLILCVYVLFRHCTANTWQIFTQNCYTNKTGHTGTWKQVFIVFSSKLVHVQLPIKLRCEFCPVPLTVWCECYMCRNRENEEEEVVIILCDSHAFYSSESTTCGKKAARELTGIVNFSECYGWLKILISAIVIAVWHSHGSMNILNMQSGVLLDNPRQTTSYLNPAWPLNIPNYSRALLEAICQLVSDSVGNMSSCSLLPLLLLVSRCCIYVASAFQYLELITVLDRLIIVATLIFKAAVQIWLKLHVSNVRNFIIAQGHTDQQTQKPKAMLGPAGQCFACAWLEVHPLPWVAKLHGSWGDYVT